MTGTEHSLDYTDVNAVCAALNAVWGDDEATDDILTGCPGELIDENASSYPSRLMYLDGRTVEPYGHIQRWEVGAWEPPVRTVRALLDLHDSLGVVIDPADLDPAAEMEESDREAYAERVAEGLSRRLGVRVRTTGATGGRGLFMDTHRLNSLLSEDAARDARDEWESAHYAVHVDGESE